MSNDFEVEFKWKEVVIYWEGERGVVLPGGWGSSPLVTYIPDAASWDSIAPAWLRGRHAEVAARLRSVPRHVVQEDSKHQWLPLEEVSR